MQSDRYHADHDRGGTQPGGAYAELIGGDGEQRQSRHGQRHEHEHPGSPFWSAA